MKQHDASRSALREEACIPKLIPPYGGSLVNLIVDDERRQEWIPSISGMKELQLTQRNLCDLELLSYGAFSPVHQFMSERDYECVVEQMRLADGTVWPMPITLAANQPDAYSVGEPVALRDLKHGTLAVMLVQEIYKVDIEREAKLVFGGNAEHPAVQELRREGRFRLAGPIEVLGLPQHRDFVPLRHTPASLRALMESKDWGNVVAFQTRNPLHRAHEELTKRAAKALNAGLLIHAVVGKTKEGDIDHYTRVQCYQELVKHYYSPDEVVLSLLPLAMRMAGPREALWHAIIRRNYGANYLIVGRDHAGPGKDSLGNPYYSPYEAQDLVRQHQEEIGVRLVPFQDLVYVPRLKTYMPIDQVPPDTPIASLSGTQVRDEYLGKGRKLPEWFSRPEVAEILQHAYPPKHRQGLTLWLTGLSCAGKTTISELLIERLLEYGRKVTLLDGDLVRTQLSKGLGFSKEDRDTNIRRIGFVAAEITRHGGTVICAAISPYKNTRDEIRRQIGDNFFEVYVNAPLEICERRDAKGLYKKARAGLIKAFTGIDDPYEAPDTPEVTCYTHQETVEESVEKIICQLLRKGFICPSISDPVFSKGEGI